MIVTGVREVQTVLHTAAEVLAKLWAPILCHTTGEINSFMKFNETSIHLESFKKLDLDFDTEKLREEMNVLFAVRKDVFKALEEARANQLIGKSLEAHVLIHVDADTKAVIDQG